VRSITIVCRANRIRSPLAAAMLASAAGNAANRIVIRSAGTRATPESSFDPRAQAAAGRLGLRMTGRPATLTDELVATSEMLLVMDRIVEAEVLTRFPQAARKVLLPGDVLGAGADHDREVCDPDTVSPPEFDRFVSRLATLAHRIAERLQPACDRCTHEPAGNVSR
jgi:protein-tyrosine-phosphatase